MSTIKEPSKLELLAIEVGLQAPLKANPYVTKAYIPWSVINDIRQELTRSGVNWQKHCRTFHNQRNAKRREQQ